ncbi:hypothetical protein ASZ78_007333 [Callipepla squamata]|uniref:Uncharacterized protein n=1 Tax=Callipepla squamata TaxID=9009 RepID=A0A226NGU2_CALSU|nr:hypothetical protein ASZ78_007333 [Callipepla squamata]
MAAGRGDALSQDELRKRLYQTFKDRGVLDALKTQLRKQLIHELMHPILSGELQPQTVPSDDSSLLITASNSLVADHLQRCGYEYSLSVFFPESGLEKKKILMGLTEHHLSKECHARETQTISVPPYRESLAEKLQLIDEQFADSYPQHHKYEPLEGKLHEYRKEIEKQLQEEMSQKLQHFKEVEIAKIKMEEKAQSQKEISELRYELERTHQAKAEALISREKNAIERLQRQQEIEAKEVYAQRQSLLKDIEVMRTREAELRQRIEAFEITQKLQEEKNKTIDDALRRREVAVKNIEETYDQKLKTELLKTNKVTEDEQKNKAFAILPAEKAMLLREEAVAVNSKKEELKQAVSRTKELELDLESLKAQVLLVNKQNQLLTEKLKEVSDYPLLKEEKLELQVQNKLLRQQLDETRTENQHLRNKLSQPSAEHLACQAELRKVEHSRRLAMDEFESHKQLLEKQLQSELWISLFVLTVTHVLDLEALENEVYRNPKPSLVDRSVLDLIDDRIVPHDIYVDSIFLKNPILSDAVKGSAVPGAGYHQQLQTRSASPDSDLECMAQTRARIKELEKEEEYLEEAYRNYQHRIIQDTAAGGTPRKIQSPLLLQCAGSRVPLTMPRELLEDNLGSQRSPLSSPRGENYIGRHGQPDAFKNPSTPPHKGVPPSKCLSSTPACKLERVLRNKNRSEDASDSYLASSQQSVGQVLSPISKPQTLPRSNSISSSPSSHGGKVRLQNQQIDNQDFSDFPKPEKLVYEDLEEHVSSLEYQGDIPEQCESDVSHPSGDAVNGNHVTAAVRPAATSPRDLTVLDRRETEEQNTEDKHWEEERKAREERREGEQQGTREGEQNEMEELKEETLIQDSTKTDEEKEDEGEKCESKNSGAEELVKDSMPNPLEKYMKIIQQRREQELARESVHAKGESRCVTDACGERGRAGNGRVQAAGFGLETPQPSTAFEVSFLPPSPPLISHRSEAWNKQQYSTLGVLADLALSFLLHITKRAAGNRTCGASDRDNRTEMR